MKSVLPALLLVPGLALTTSAALGQDKPAADPYPLATCPISGQRLGSMGEPIVKLYDGREVRFCCGGCPPKFEKDFAKNMARLDQAVVQDQEPFYPMDASVVSGKRLDSAGKAYDFVYNNRLVRLAADSEKAVFLKDPPKYLAALDKAVIAKQSKAYPLSKCPISGEVLGKMGQPKDIIVAGRLIRLCCAACQKDIHKDPAKYVAMIEEARKPTRETDKKNGPAAYTCSMHPEVKGSSPGKCPKCGMALVRK